MVKKLFALASVSALGGLVAAVNASGCSSTEVVPGDAATDAKTDRKIGEDDSGPSGCFVEDAIDATKYKYSPATIKPGACTTKDVDDIIAYVKANAQATFTDLQTEVQAKFTDSCFKCIFAEDGPTWSPIITQGGKIVSLNSSGCVEIASGKGAECGKAHRQWDQCIDEACAKCDDSELSECGKEVQSGSCKAATEALGLACGNNVNAYLQACRGTYGFDEWIRKQCVGTGLDAATDG